MTGGGGRRRQRGKRAAARGSGNDLSSSGGRMPDGSTGTASRMTLRQREFGVPSVDELAVVLTVSSLAPCARLSRVPTSARGCERFAFFGLLFFFDGGSVTGAAACSVSPIVSGLTAWSASPPHRHPLGSAPPILRPSSPGSPYCRVRRCVLSYPCSVGCRNVRRARVPTICKAARCKKSFDAHAWRCIMKSVLPREPAKFVDEPKSRLEFQGAQGCISNSKIGRAVRKQRPSRFCGKLIRY